MVKTFRFEEDGRDYACSMGLPHPPQKESWWWFVVSGDRQRYAAFRADAGDTLESVRSRVMQFYNNRLARLAEPPMRRGFGGRPRPVVAVTPAAPASNGSETAYPERPAALTPET